TFVFGVGLGGLIILNLLEKVDLPVEGMILVSPMLELRKTGKGRKNKIISNIGKVSKDTRFKVGIISQDLTRNEEIIEETDNDGLMLKKVTYRWYNLINEKMKETMDHIKDIKSLPAMIMYGTEDKAFKTFPNIKLNVLI
ncbi:MAG: alpha/beta hydrolase, partial [Rickettsia endosymbiont of Ixodes persulcatus]|nr:alpha/beta hydrolase [Rickettsia endosymbiont of Ixodes persulcatus]